MNAIYLMGAGSLCIIAACLSQPTTLSSSHASNLIGRGNCEGLCCMTDACPTGCTAGRFQLKEPDNPTQPIYEGTYQLGDTCQHDPLDKRCGSLPACDNRFGFNGKDCLFAGALCPLN